MRTASDDIHQQPAQRHRRHHLAVRRADPAADRAVRVLHRRLPGPRSSYLVGATLGLLDGILWSALFLISPSAQPGAAGRLVQPSDFVAIILVAVVVGVLAAGFASWYRNFLRSSQERARQNRATREQQQKVKAKDDARAARDAQRQTKNVTADDQRHDTALQAVVPGRAYRDRGALSTRSHRRCG